jgi:hypothetical protein
MRVVVRWGRIKARRTLLRTVFMRPLFFAREPGTLLPSAV